MIKLNILIISMIFIVSCSQSKVDDIQINTLCDYTLSPAQEKIFLNTKNIINEAVIPNFPISENLSRKVNTDGAISCVLLEFELLPSGELINVNVLNKDQKRSFIRSSIRALRRYTFKSIDTQTSGIVSIKYVLE